MYRASQVIRYWLVSGIIYDVQLNIYAGYFGLCKEQRQLLEISCNFFDSRSSYGELLRLFECERFVPFALVVLYCIVVFSDWRNMVPEVITAVYYCSDQ